MKRIAMFFGIVVFLVILSVSGVVAQEIIEKGPVFNTNALDHNLFEVSNLTVDPNGFGTNVHVSPGDRLEFRVYVHNNEPDTVAENTVVKINLIPAGIYGEENIVLTANITADNANKVVGRVSINLGEYVKLTYVEGSAKRWWFTDEYMTNMLYEKLPDSIWNGQLDLGNVQGCFQYVQYITFWVNAEESLPDLSQGQIIVDGQDHVNDSEFNPYVSDNPVHVNDSEFYPYEPNNQDHVNDSEFESYNGGLPDLSQGQIIVDGDIDPGQVIDILGLPVFNTDKQDKPTLQVANISFDQNKYDSYAYVSPGDQVVFKVYIHNNEIGTVAEGTEIFAFVTEGYLSRHVASATILAKNVEMVSGSVVVYSDTPCKLEYVQNTTKRWWFTGKNMEYTQYEVMPNTIFTDGINIGDITGCWEYIQYVTYVFNVVADPDFSGDKSFNEDEVPVP